MNLHLEYEHTLSFCEIVGGLRLQWAYYEVPSKNMCKYVLESKRIITLSFENLDYHEIWDTSEILVRVVGITKTSYTIFPRKAELITYYSFLKQCENIAWSQVLLLVSLY